MRYRRDKSVTKREKVTNRQQNSYSFVINIDLPFLHDILKSGKRTYLTGVILSDSTSTDRRNK